MKVTKKQAVMHNDLVDLCRVLTDDKPEVGYFELLARIKSLVHGPHITKNGLYWQGINMSP